MQKFVFGIIILLLSSCSPNDDLLKKLAVNCMCEITSYWELSTDKQASNTREVSFNNSKVFDFEVSKKSFALSSSILLNREFENKSFTTIKLNFVLGDESEQNVESYTFKREEIEKISSKYFEVERIINEFISAIYNNDIAGNYGLTEIDISYEEYESVFKNLNEELEKGYIDTRIVGYEILNSTYHTTSGIYLESGNLLLFSIRLKEINNKLKIIGFDF